MIQNSKIIISKDLDKALEITLPQIQISKNRVILFQKNNFLIEDSREIIREAFLSSNEKKFIVLCAKSYNLFAQNALLKILEEPPKNTIFLLFSNSKSSLIPTIRSRLPLETVKFERNPISIEFSIQNINNKNLFVFLKANQRISKDDTVQLVEKLFYESIQLGIEFSEEEFNILSKYHKLLNLNTKPISILTSFFLLLKRKIN